MLLYVDKILCLQLVPCNVIVQDRITHPTWIRVFPATPQNLDALGPWPLSFTGPGNPGNLQNSNMNTKIDEPCSSGAVFPLKFLANKRCVAQSIFGGRDD